MKKDWMKGFLIGVALCSTISIVLASTICYLTPKEEFINSGNIKSCLNDLLPDSNNETVYLIKKDDRYFAVHRYDYDGFSEWRQNLENLLYEDENGTIIVNSTLYIGQLFNPLIFGSIIVNHYHWDQYRLDRR